MPITIIYTPPQSFSAEIADQSKQAVNQLHNLTKKFFSQTFPQKYFSPISIFFKSSILYECKSANYTPEIKNFVRTKLEFLRATLKHKLDKIKQMFPSEHMFSLEAQTVFKNLRTKHQMDIRHILWKLTLQNQLKNHVFLRHVEQVERNHHPSIFLNETWKSSFIAPKLINLCHKFSSDKRYYSNYKPDLSIGNWVHTYNFNIANQRRRMTNIKDELFSMKYIFHSLRSYYKCDNLNS